MAVPQRRTSKTRKRLRRTHFKLNAKGLVVCSHCGEMIQSHHVCPFCGYYNGKLIIAKKAKKTEEPVKEAKKASKKADKKAEKTEEKKESK